jgi:hypothetical protein
MPRYGFERLVFKKPCYILPTRLGKNITIVGRFMARLSGLLVERERGDPRRLPDVIAGCGSGIIV